MPDIRVSRETYLNHQRNITAIPDHYVALPAQISATHAVERDGKKYILGGTAVTNATELDGRRTGLTPVTETGGVATEFDGLIFTDQEVYPGETTVTVTVLVHGFVKYSSIQKAEAGTVVPTSKNPMILVMK